MSLFPRKETRFGIAFSGGGIRCLAQLGAWKSLENAGIPMASMVSGTSAGSLIAACYALGFTSDQVFHFTIGSGLDELLEAVSSGEAGVFNLRNITPFTRRSFSFTRDSAQIERVARRMTGHLTFSDTKIPLTVVAVDLKSGNEVRITQGDLALACRASSSVPGIFTPTETDGMMLVDGCLLNNLPADVLRESGCEVVLGLDLEVEPHHEAESARLTDVLAASFSVMANHARKKNRPACDVLACPDMRPYSKFKAGREQMLAMYRIGMIEMDRLIPVLKEKLSTLDRQGRTGS